MMMRRLLVVFVFLQVIINVAISKSYGHAAASKSKNQDIDLSAEVKLAPGKSWKTIVISSVRPVKSNLTIPSTVCLKFADGGLFDVQEGVTLTINGPVEAPPVRIFQGNGKVTFGPGLVERVYPQWWGAQTEDAVDDTAAIQAAIDATPSTGGVVSLPRGNYAISSRLTLRSELTLEGGLPRAVLNATKPLPAMLQRPDLTPPPEGIHYNKDTRIDGGKLANLYLRGNGSKVGLDLTNVNYTWIENVQVDTCKTGILLSQLGMYETIVNPVVSYCDTGIEFNVGSMDSNIFGGRISACKIGILINVTGHLNIYGITFDAYKETGIDIRGGDCVNLHYAWFDSVAQTTAIKIGSKARQCTVVNPRFSGPTPKEIANESETALILDASYDMPTTLTSDLLKTRALQASGISATDMKARNLRGRVTISGAKRNGPVRAWTSVKFPVSEADENYFIVATCVSSSGDVPSGARIVSIKDKTKTGFDVVLEDAPGAGNSVDVDWILVR